MRPNDYLRHIWKRSERGLVFLPVREAATGTWVEGPALPSDAPLSDEQAPGYDYYFTPSTYALDPRRKEHLANMGVLYADLDDKYNKERLDLVPPTLLWETSPSRMQAIWFLNRPHPPVEAIAINRRLSLFLDADHGSWMPTKLLRVPGTVNWKRGGVEGQVLAFNTNVYTFGELDDLLPHYPESISGGDDVPMVPSLPEHKALLRKWWPRLSHRAKKLMASQQVADRSLVLATLAEEMATIKIPPDEIFGLLSRLPINKFRNRPLVLWQSVVLTAVGRSRIE